MTAPHGIEWLLQQAESGERSNRGDLSRELGSFTLPELLGLIYHCRLYNPILWVTTDEEAERADYRWITLETVCRTELSRRDVPFVPYEPEFQEQLEGYAAFLTRMAAIGSALRIPGFDERQNRGVLVTGLVVVFTRNRNEYGSYSHLSLSALDRVPSSQEVDAVVKAFFGGWQGVHQRKGWSREDIRHFVKADATLPDQNGMEVDLKVVTTEELVGKLLTMLANSIEDYRSYLGGLASPEEIQSLELITLAFFTTVWTVRQHPTLASLSEGVPDTILDTLGKSIDEYLVEKFGFDGGKIKELQAIIDERFIEYESVADLAIHSRDDETLDGPRLWRECGNLMYSRLTGRVVTPEDNTGAAFCAEFAARYYRVRQMLSEYIVR